MIGPDHPMTTQKRDVQTDQSGYDGLPTTLDSMDVTTSPIVFPIGIMVYNVQGQRLGDIGQYDVPRRLLFVEKGILRPRMMFVPFSAIRTINREDLTGT